MSRSHWRLLGISATPDRKEIRSAYARQLKSGKFDEADAFARLRSARDHALALADAGVVVEPSDSTTSGAPQAAISFAYAPPLWPSDIASIPAGPITFDDRPHPLFGEGFRADRDGSGPPIGVHANLLAPRIQGHETASAVQLHAVQTGLQDQCREIYDILYGADQAEPLIDEDAATLGGAVSRTIHLASSEGVEQQADFENWLAECIARTAPRSDPALQIAATAFNWVERGRMLDASQAIAWLGARRDALNFIGQLESPKHRWHRAYRELRTPAGEHSRRGRLVGSRKVRDLLTYVRSHQPLVEDTFDPWRISLWESAAQNRNSVANWVWIVIVVINVVRLVATGGPNPATPPSPMEINAPVEVTPEAAITMVLPELDDPDLTAAELDRRNPALFADLVELWKTIYAHNGSANEFRAAAADLMTKRAERALATASYEISQDRVITLRNMAEKFNAENPRYCVDFLGGKKMLDEWLAPYAKSNRHIMTEALLDRSTPSTLPERQGTFAIPGTIMADIGRRTHLDDAAVRKTLAGKNGNDDEACKVRLALMDAALAAKPSVALSVLQGL